MFYEAALASRPKAYFVLQHRVDLSRGFVYSRAVLFTLAVLEGSFSDHPMKIMEAKILDWEPFPRPKIQVHHEGQVRVKVAFPAALDYGTQDEPDNESRSDGYP